MPYLAEAAEVVRSRFKCWDGSGYPHGLRGDASPLLGRILAVADTFDILQQPRPYRPAMDEPQALAEMRRCRATQFDPAVVQAFERLHAARHLNTPLARIIHEGPKQSALRASTRP